MAQATYVPNIAHDKAEALAFFTAAFEAIATNNAGATAPTETFPGMWWWDTSTTPPTLRQRNVANSAWVEFAPPTSTNPDFAVNPSALATRATIKTFVDAALNAGVASRVYDIQEFTVTGSWIKPASAASGDKVLVHLVGGGGSGALGTSSRGGAGGGGLLFQFDDIDALSATESVVIGAGGAARSTSGVLSGFNGGSTTFGTSGLEGYLRAGGGGGGGATSDPNRAVSTIFTGGITSPLFFEQFNALHNSPGEYGGGGGSSGVGQIGSSVFAGRGGNGASNANAENGQFPGGGGGSVQGGLTATRTSGAGANGFARIYCIREST